MSPNYKVQLLTLVLITQSTLWLVVSGNALQSVVTELQVIDCSSCSVKAEYSTRTIPGITTAAAQGISSGTSQVFFVASSYGYLTSSFTNGACNVAKRPVQTLSTPFSILSQPNFTNLGYTLASYFIGHVGYTDCGFEPGLPMDFLKAVFAFLKEMSSSIPLSSSSLPSSSLPSSSLPSSSLPSSSLPSSSLPSSLPSLSSPSNASSSPTVRGAPPKPDTKDKKILSIVLPIITVLATTFGVLIWLRYRKRKLAAADATDKDLANSREERQPYLQKKPELEDDGRRIHELYTQSQVTREDIQPYLQQKTELEDDERRIHELPTRSNRYEIG